MFLSFCYRMQIPLILKSGRQNISEGVLAFFKPMERETENITTAIFLCTEDLFVILLLNRYNFPFNV